MKRVFTIGVAAMLLLGGTMTSCNKYEEGPGFALSSKKSRISNDWVMSAATSGSTTTTYTADESPVKISIKKDGTYTYSTTFMNTTFSSNGTWEFNDDKTKLLTTEEGDTDVNEMIIVELRKDQLKLKDTGEDPTTITYVPQ